MDILKNIDELLISWGTAPSLADMLDQFIAFVLAITLRIRKQLMTILWNVS